VVYASPEILLNKKSHFFKHTMTQETTFSQNLTLIAMDEAHTVWSNRNYRREFSQIFRLRLAFPQVPFAALSATFPPHVVSYVQRTCGMKSTCNIITMNGRRVNIDIVVAEQPKQKLLQPLFNDLIPPNLRRKEEIPKTFIFVDSVLSARRVAIALRRKFRKKRLNEDTKVLVRTYYSSIDLPMKQKTHELIESGDARIVICTDSLSLGVDFPDIERVIQWGVDEKLDLNTLVQRIGRAARDPEVQGIATIYAPKAAFEPVSKAVGEAQEVHHAAEAVNKVAVEGAANGDASGWEDEEYAGVIPCYQNRDLASYALPVTSETLTMVEKFAAKMYKHAENLDNIVAEAINEQMGSKTGQPTKRKRFIDKIEPALLWFLNTTGCRHRCILHYLRYPDVFTDRQQRSWCCDNCAIRCGLRPKDTSTAGMSLALSIRAPPSALQQLPATIAKAPMAPRPVDMIQMPTRFRECLENYRTEAWSQLVSRGVIAASFPEHLVLPNSALRKIVASVRDIHSVESVVQILKSVKFDTHASLIGAEGAADIFTRINALVEDHIRTSGSPTSSVKGLMYCSNNSRFQWIATFAWFPTSHDHALHPRADAATAAHLESFERLDAARSTRSRRSRFNYSGGGSHCTRAYHHSVVATHCFVDQAGKAEGFRSQSALDIRKAAWHSTCRYHIGNSKSITCQTSSRRDGRYSGCIERY